MHLIILHAYQITVPSPAKGDTCIRYIVNGIMLNSNTADIACSYGYTTPVLITNVTELRLLYGQPSANLSEVGWLVW